MNECLNYCITLKINVYHNFESHNLCSIKGINARLVSIYFLLDFTYILHFINICEIKVQVIGRFHNIGSKMINSPLLLYLGELEEVY